ncbi:MAG: M23 family metallopeptidase [Candidatus Gracilibacteria bacterium]|nr:M23 family metallopeptidase [Candidatus Gracilibacteria bacterium]
MVRYFWILAVSFFIFGIFSCVSEETRPVNYPFEGGGGKSFKIPVPKGYDWEVSQSWAEHCSECNSRYPSDDISYCSSSHMDNCCKYSWDFNLPGNADKGKSVLATADGVVKKVSKGSAGWGNTVVLDHGDNVCSRYAHLLDNSITVKEGDSVCQGLIIGKIGNTGSSSGEHLHFHFENCSSGKSMEMGFTDGNGIPICTRGQDRYNSSGNYIALKLTNTAVTECGNNDVFSGETLPSGGWLSASCGALSGCPMIHDCGRSQSHKFDDNSSMNSRVRKAVNYLYGECAIDGKSDGKFHAEDSLTRAQALKIPLYLFGLAENCGNTQPFSDVKSGDWFFGVVACGVRYGLLEYASYFNPNDEVTFSQAAKFVAMTAAQAGVIDIQNPKNGNFPNIGKDHWAYSYVETLYYYGGLLDSPSKYSSGQKLTRGEYALMVASMSPCFCENVSCSKGCTCNQETFSCKNSSTAPGVGGDDDDEEEEENDDEEEEENDDEEDDDEDYNSDDDSYIDIEMNCFVSPTSSECQGKSTLLYIKCTATNFGDQDIKINNMEMHLLSSSNKCEVTDATMKNEGVSTQTAKVGEELKISGHFEILCSSLDMKEIEVSFDLKERIGGVETWYYDAMYSSIEIKKSELPSCQPKPEEPPVNPPKEEDDDPPPANPPPKDPPPSDPPEEEDDWPPPDLGGYSGSCAGSYCWVDWDCDPNVPYNVYIWSPEGVVQVLTPSLQYSVHTLTAQANWEFFYSFPCDYLPLGILLISGPNGGKIKISPSSYANAAFYTNYQGGVTLNPVGSPNYLMPKHEFTTPFLKVLAQIPFSG